MNNIYSTLSVILLCFFYCMADEFDIPTEMSSSLSKDSIKKHVNFLGSDSLQGRGTGTPGGYKVAQYIADNLRKFNLLPLGDEKTYFQNVPMHSSFPLSESLLRLSGESGIYDFELGEEYVLYKYGEQTYIPTPVSMVFAGYGIIAPEFDYNDYQSIDVAGKIVVILGGEPYSTDSMYFDGKDATIYSLPEAKQRLAISRGALGSILIPNPQFGLPINWGDYRREFAFLEISLIYTVSGQLSLLMKPSAASILFENATYSLKDIYAMEENQQIQSFPLDAKISFKGEFIEKDFIDRNVIGMVRGTNTQLNKQYLILSAHYDHLGIGPPVEGDSIYNGVADNAIGVAALLELARVFKTYQQAINRSIIFLFVTGEEKGFLGSKYYLDHPVVPLFKTVANINIDGIAIFDTFNDIVGVGAELSTLGKILNDVASKLGLKVSPIPVQFQNTESFSRSDQLAFAQAGIPSILVMDGLNYRNISREAGLRKAINWIENIYHSPFDDLNQPINYDAAYQHCQVLAAYCYTIANRQDVAEWNESTPYINIRLQTIAEER